MDNASQQQSYPTLLDSASTSTMRKPSSFPGVENEAVKSLLDSLLMAPTRELRERPSHQFRAHLVGIGAQLSGRPFAQESSQMRACSEAIEYLHLGSLIVDDIQDGSAVRRNGPSLHARLGVPHALSVGNWLYFRALRLLNQLELDGPRRLLLEDQWHEAMEFAHYGQVMDLSVSVEHISPDKLVEVCHHCALYKTGSITGLAIGMGALIHGASPRRLAAVKTLGSALGVYLQQLNDLGNVVGNFDTEKRFEDLLSRKPSFIWSFALDHLGRGSYERLLKATYALPDDASMLRSWVEEHSLEVHAPLVAEKTFDKAVDAFQELYPKTDLTTLLTIKDRIKKAYA